MSYSYIYHVLVLSVFFLLIAPGSVLAQGPGASSFNPSIGMNSLFLYQNSNRGNAAYAEDRNGVSIQEASLEFMADVDAFWKFVGIFSFHQDVTVDNTTLPPTRTAEYVFEPEELYAESLAWPPLTFRIGKFKAAFGEHNQLHTDAFPFIDAPLANRFLLGDEGLNDLGFSVNGSVSNPWSMDFTLQIISGHGEDLDYYNGSSANDAVALGRWNNSLNLSDQMSLSFGGSAATGKNAGNRTTNFYGTDMTLEWNLSGAKSLIWSAEYIAREHNRATDEKGSGFSTWVQYQHTQNLWAQIRGEYLDMRNQDPASPEPLPDYQNKKSVLIGYAPTEFSAVRFQYDHLDDETVDPEHKLMLQLKYSIGAHPARAQ